MVIDIFKKKCTVKTPNKGHLEPSTLSLYKEIVSGVHVLML